MLAKFHFRIRFPLLELLTRSAADIITAAAATVNVRVTAFQLLENARSVRTDNMTTFGRLFSIIIVHQPSSSLN
jgi:hypothetical protein